MMRRRQLLQGAATALLARGRPRRAPSLARLRLRIPGRACPLLPEPPPSNALAPVFASPV